MRFTPDLSCVRCLDPQADIDILALWKAIRDQMRTPELRKHTMHRLQETLSTGLQLSNSQTLLSDSPEQDLQRLARTYLERLVPKRESRLATAAAHRGRHDYGPKSFVRVWTRQKPRPRINAWAVTHVGLVGAIPASSAGPCTI